MNTICTIYRLGPTHWYGILRLDREKAVIISGTSLGSLILRAFEAVAEGSANRRERSMQEVITYLEQVSVPEGARYWIQSAIRHLREGDGDPEPRLILAAACCLREAAYLLKEQQTKRWLESMVTYLEREAFR